jgi:hypothetical protein
LVFANSYHVFVLCRCTALRDISHERFLKLSADYEAEQKELTEQVKVWRQAAEM